MVTLPPLRHRQSDIPVLADFFARRMALELGWESFPGFSEGAMATLQAYAWPGNVRELRNVIERAVYRWEGQEGPIQDIQFDPFDSPWRPVAANENRRLAAPAPRRCRTRRWRPPGGRRPWPTIRRLRRLPHCGRRI